jgi:hypothetical protein
MLFSVSRVLSKKHRIEKEKELVEEAFRELQLKSNKALFYLTRLRKQKRVLLSKGTKIVCRGL